MCVNTVGTFNSKLVELLYSGSNVLRHQGDVTSSGRWVINAYMYNLKYSYL